MFVATAMADPELDPPGLSARLYGFRLWPPRLEYPSALFGVSRGIRRERGRLLGLMRGPHRRPFRHIGVAQQDGIRVAEEADNMGVTGYFGANQHYGRGLGEMYRLGIHKGLTGRAGRSLHLVIGSDVLGPPDGLATPVGTNLAGSYSHTRTSFTRKGIPWRGPRRMPCCLSRSVAAAMVRASGLVSITALQYGRSRR